jgi:hypothetical protein
MAGLHQGLYSGLVTQKSSEFSAVDLTAVNAIFCKRSNTASWSNITYGRFRTLIKTLFFSILLAFASYALFHPAADAASANAATVELVPSSRVILEITADMTVDDIIERVYPKDKNLWPRIKQKLIETNPQSFVQYTDRLIPGVRLKLVDIKRIYEQPEVTLKVRIGNVVSLTGNASTSDANGRVQQLQIKSQIYQGDLLETEPGSNLHVIMDDGAEVFLKQDSLLKVSEYVITSGYDKDSSSILDLLRGGLRKITGAIGASPAANYQVHTGFATIGIRGTEYVLQLCKQDDCSTTASRDDADAKLHAVVLEGAITLTTDEQLQIQMAPGEYGTATSETLVLEETKQVAAGLLNSGEANRFDATNPQSLEQDKESSNTWMWIAGVLLLLVGL